MEIRKATIDDLALVSAVEAECFPPAEAATKGFFQREAHLLRQSFLAPL